MKSCRLHFILLFFIILVNDNYATSHWQPIVDTLPGYTGTLPFTLETGYIGVGEDDEVQLFYYFIESENDPRRDPLVLWITDGPGCSGLSALVYEIGPFSFDFEDFDGSLPCITINPYSWSKIASIIFIDSPVGTGFSYSTSSEGYVSSDTNTAKYNYDFLRKWLSNHPSFYKNRLYIGGGGSYGGKIVPMVALQIAEDNEDGILPKLTLLGYIIGNSAADASRALNERVRYAHRTGLISDEYFELGESSCDGEYVYTDPKNIACAYALELIGQCIYHINNHHILESACKFMSPKPSNRSLWSQQFLEDPVDLLLLSKQQEELKCRTYNYVSSYVWANNETVQEALHVRKGTKTDWKRCNTAVQKKYKQDVGSVLRYHQLLTEKGFQALVFSGDHDLTVPYTSTLEWIRELNLTLSERWRPWTVDGQIAGYTLQYSNDQSYLTFATVKGAGHAAPEYMPKECFAMIKRWISLYPL